MSNRLTRIFVIALLLVTMIAGSAVACPTCKDAISGDDPHQQAIAAGYQYSILFMMSMPFLIVGTLSSLAYISIRNAREAQALEDDGGFHVDL